jgi:hypothetical protein
MTENRELMPLNADAGGDGFPLWLKVCCGITGVVVLGIAIAIFLNVRKQQHEALVSRATKQVELLVAQGDTAFQLGKLDEAQAAVDDARVVSLASNGASIDVLSEKIESERGRQEAERMESEKLAAEAKRKVAADELARRQEEEVQQRAANVKAEQERETVALALHQAELDKLDELQSGFWLLLDASLKELTRNVDAQVEKFEVTVRLAKKELEKQSDPDLAQLRRLEYRELVQEGTKEIVKVELEMDKAYQAQMKQLTLGGSKPLPKYFEDRFRAAVKKEVARVNAALNKLPQ